MSDYISRKAAVKIAQKYGLANGSALGRRSGLADCIAIEIEGLPAADVEPVRHNRLLTTIQVAVLLYKERIGHEPGAILLERGAYDVVTEATREVTLIRGQNGKATVTLFGIPVERVLRPGYGFYISERCCVNPGGAENAAD